MFVSLFISTAFADVPKTVRPALAPADAPAQYAELRSRKGLDEDPLVCDDLWPDARLCFRVWDGKTRRWVVESDAKRWNVSVGDLTSAMRSRSEARLAEMDVVEIDGMGRQYLRLSDGDGWAAAMVLHPGAVAGKLGGALVLVGAPTDLVTLAWASGDADTDKVMAIGVKEIYDGEDGLSVSPVVYAWIEGAWRPFGEAKRP